MTPARQLARILDAADRTGELDWSLVREDFEIHAHELPDSSNRLCEAPPCGGSARLPDELREVVLGECHEGARGR